ncbi:LOW QUALITY PROTEIN: hypothetical protein PHMEG_00040650, partial [Phytophthora megakarya]
MTLSLCSRVPRQENQQNNPKTMHFAMGLGNQRGVKSISFNKSTLIYGNKTAWWNTDLSKNFLEFHFAKRENPDEKIILLWDDFSAHWTPEVTNYAASLNVLLLKVPLKYTYVCQPADISWNKPFK